MMPTMPGGDGSEKHRHEVRQAVYAHQRTYGCTCEAPGPLVMMDAFATVLGVIHDGPHCERWWMSRARWN